MIDSTASLRDLPIHVILVDDEDAIRKATRQWLNLADIEVDDYPSADLALPHIQAGCHSVIVSDVRMPGMSGTAFARQVQTLDAELPVILVTAHGDVSMAVNAMRDGVYDFIEKPVEPDLLIDRIRRASERRRLVLENRALQRLIEQGPSLENRMIGRSPTMMALRKQILQLGQTPVDAVINGATGTGKELVARCLHEFSTRSHHPFVAVNCGAIPEALFESELFGHEKGSFTGAHSRRIGKIEHAQGGTLFLDEIESMPINFQIKLLRVLQERRLERVGSNQEIELDIWVIAASKVNLAEASAAGDFREDLYYRFNVVELHLPKLAERRDDVPLLFEFFARKASLQYDRDYDELDEQDVAILMEHPWPGNVRQLKNVAERYVLGMSANKSIAAILGLQSETTPKPPTGGLSDRVQRFERQLIAQSLQRHHGNVQAVMEELDLPRRTLNNKMRLYALDRRDYLSANKDA